MMKCLEVSLNQTDPKSTLITAIDKMTKIHKDENYGLLGSSTAVCLTIDKENKT